MSVPDSGPPANSMTFTGPQLAFLYDLYLSEISPVTDWKLGFAGTWNIVRSFIPGVTYHQITRAVRHFSGLYIINFEQFVQLFHFFLFYLPETKESEKDSPGIEESEKKPAAIDDTEKKRTPREEITEKANRSIRYVLTKEKDSFDILVQMYPELIKEHKEFQQARMRPSIQGETGLDLMNSIVNCLVNPDRLKDFESRKELPPDTRISDTVTFFVDFSRVNKPGENETTFDSIGISIQIESGPPLSEDKVIRTKTEEEIIGCDSMLSERLVIGLKLEGTLTDVMSMLKNSFLKLTVRQEVGALLGDTLSWSVPVVPVLFRAPRPVRLGAFGKDLSVALLVRADWDPVVRNLARVVGPVSRNPTRVVETREPGRKRFIVGGHIDSQRVYCLALEEGTISGKELPIVEIMTDREITSKENTLGEATSTSQEAENSMVSLTQIYPRATQFDLNDVRVDAVVALDQETKSDNDLKFVCYVTNRNRGKPAPLISQIEQWDMKEPEWRLSSIKLLEDITLWSLAKLFASTEHDDTETQPPPEVQHTTDDDQY